MHPVFPNNVGHTNKYRRTKSYSRLTTHPIILTSDYNGKQQYRDNTGMPLNGISRKHKYAMKIITHKTYNKALYFLRRKYALRQYKIISMTYLSQKINHTPHELSIRTQTGKTEIFLCRY